MGFAQILAAQLAVIARHRLSNLNLAELHLRSLLVLGGLRVLITDVVRTVKRHVLVWHSSQHVVLSRRCVLKACKVVFKLNLLFCSVLSRVARRVQE